MAEGDESGADGPSSSTADRRGCKGEVPRSFGRRRGQRESLPRAGEHEYSDAEGNVLALRGALSVGSRREYAAALSGSPLSREDAEQRALELLFERLTVCWTVAGVPTRGHAVHAPMLTPP